MRLPTIQRREIIEDILDIQVFSTMNLLLRDKTRENNEEIKEFDYQIHLLEEKIDLQKQHMLTLEKRNKEEIDKKKEKIKELEDNEQQSTESIHNITEEVKDLSQEMEDYSKSSIKLKKLNTILIKLNTKLKKCKKEHQFFEDNHVCPTCTQDLSDEFRHDMIENGKAKLDEMHGGYEELTTAIESEEKRTEKFLELSHKVTERNTTITNLNYQLMTIRNLSLIHI